MTTFTAASGSLRGVLHSVLQKCRSHGWDFVTRESSSSSLELPFSCYATLHLFRSHSWRFLFANFALQNYVYERTSVPLVSLGSLVSGQSVHTSPAVMCLKVQDLVTPSLSALPVPGKHVVHNSPPEPCTPQPHRCCWRC